MGCVWGGRWREVKGVCCVLSSTRECEGGGVGGVFGKWELAHASSSSSSSPHFHKTQPPTHQQPPTQTFALPLLLSSYIHTHHKQTHTLNAQATHTHIHTHHKHTHQTHTHARTTNTHTHTKHTGEARSKALLQAQLRRNSSRLHIPSSPTLQESGRERERREEGDESTSSSSASVSASAPAVSPQGA
jgi:hypothetical protein